MTNYSQDEDDRTNDRQERAERQKDRNKPINWPQSVKLGKDEAPYTAVDIEISDDDFKSVALQAHERDITFNKMVGIILKDGLRSTGHIFEHGNKPQLLNEDK
jgi:hypothetical protein